LHFVIWVSCVSPFPSLARGTCDNLGSEEMTTDRVPAMQFKKTKLCKFEQMGRCTKGPACLFAHGDKELRSSPDLRCTRLCKTLLLGGRCQDENCTYAHSKDELRGAGQKSKMGRLMQTGTKASAKDVPPSFAEAVESLQAAARPPVESATIFSKKETGATDLWRQLSPAYVPLPSNPDTSRFDIPFCNSFDEGKATYSKFDHLIDQLLGDEHSASTQSPLTPQTPPSPPSPEKEVDNELGNLGFYSEDVSDLATTLPGFWQAPLKVPGLDGLGPFCTFATAEGSRTEPNFTLGQLNSGLGSIIAPFKGSQAHEQIDDIWKVKGGPSMLTASQLQPVRSECTLDNTFYALSGVQL